jgi:hypothetical protein
MIIGFRMAPNTFVEKAIAHLTGEPVHGAIILSDGTLFESQAPVGVEHISTSSVPDYKDWVLIDVPDADASVMTQIMIDEAGCGYDYMAAGFGWWLGWASKDEWYCTELCSYCLKKGWAAKGIDPNTKLNRKDIWYNPARLFRALTALGYKQIKVNA